MNQDIDWMAVATIVAVLLGPIIAVWVTRYFDDRKEVRARRMDIFRTLMRTRKIPIHFDHVGALNLVEIEFAKDSKVIAAWKDYLRNLGERLPPEADNDTQNALFKKRESLLTKLIYEISQVLQFKVEQLAILEGNYIPQAWNDDEFEQRIMRRAFLDVLDGRRPVSIRPYTPPQGVGPYPPAPAIHEPEQQL
jgi:Family of unknown function (DUF6680)